MGVRLECTPFVYCMCVVHESTARVYFTSDWRVRGVDGANGAHGANETVPWIIGARVAQVSGATGATTAEDGTPTVPMSRTCQGELRSQ